jgi:hypothetical protein
MSKQTCPSPLIEHRMETPQPAGVWPRTRTVIIYECSDPDCNADPEQHKMRLPCRWSWKLAHGKQHNGSSFPARRCPRCQHIRRAGKPAKIQMLG